MPPLSHALTRSYKDDYPATNVLQKFTLFPKLPTEIQLRIFKLALPGYNGKRLLCISACRAVDTKTNSLLFDILAYENKLSRDSFFVGLLKACYASREVYKAAFPNTLYVHNYHSNGRAYFDKASTLIYLENFEDLVLDQRFGEQLARNSRGGRWPVEVEHLAIPFVCTCRCRLDGLLFRLQRFFNLKSLVLVMPEDGWFRRNGRTQTIPAKDDKKSLRIAAQAIHKYISETRGRYSLGNGLQSWLTYKLPPMYVMGKEGVFVDRLGKEYEFPGCEVKTKSMEDEKLAPIIY